MMPLPAVLLLRILPTPKPLYWLYANIFGFEWQLMVAVVVCGLLAANHLGWLRKPNLMLRDFARRRVRAVVTIMLLGAGARLAMVPQLRIPRPAIHDEFGYLLTADTFLHGRLTNPTPPLWQHFETLHTFFVPTYQSQYPFTQGAALAFGQLLFGHYWWGVFFTTVIFCGATVWALQAWMPPYWAFIAGLFIVVRVAVFSYWMNSYWGGSIAALGGALIVGALPRLAPLARRDVYRASRKKLCALFVGLGLALLATTRPFEGLIVSVPLLLGLLAAMLKLPRGERGTRITEVLIAIAVVMVPLFAFNAYYNYRVTGSSLKAPYTVALEQYHVAQPFIFQEPRPIPHYRHLTLRFLYVHFELAQAERNKTLWGFLEAAGNRFQSYWSFYVGPMLTLPFLFSFRAYRQRRFRLLWLATLVLAVGVLLESWVQVHYIAPAFVIIALVLVQGARFMRTLRFGRYRAGLFAARPLLVTCAALIFIRAIFFAQNVQAHQWPPSWEASGPEIPARNQLEDRLNARPGKQIVIVRYDPAYHDMHRDWIFNGADFDEAKTLWARSMNVNDDCELVRYYHGVRGREIWTVDEAGAVVRIMQQTEAQICDPKNWMYRPNMPARF